MLGQESGINHRFFLISIGIQIAAYVLHAIQYVPSTTLLCAFEQHVLNKMRHALLVFGLIACTGINGIAAISHFRLNVLMDNA